MSHLHQYPPQSTRSRSDSDSAAFKARGLAKPIWTSIMTSEHARIVSYVLLALLVFVFFTVQFGDQSSSSNSSTSSWLFGQTSCPPSSVGSLESPSLRDDAAEALDLSYANAAKLTPMNILVTGGAGYIGSHMSILLLDQMRPYRIVAVDDLSRGDIRNVQRVQQYASTRKQHTYEFVRGDIIDGKLLSNLLKERSIELVIHFAGFAYASESVAEPLKYYDNTVTRIQTLLSAMDVNGVRRLLYSSSSAVYGSASNPNCRLAEDAILKPLSPYGESKLMAEHIVTAYAKSKHLKGEKFSYAALRYFNVIGADSKLRVGPLPKKSLSHYGRVVDGVFDALVEDGKDKKPMNIYGDDYTETPDGSAIRDYIHVSDLVDAHLLISYALKDNAELVYNIGYGKGNTVKQLVATIEQVTSKKVPVKIQPRRPGDPPIVIGDPTKLTKHFPQWKPQYSELKKALQTAWDWRMYVEKQLNVEKDGK